MNRPKELEDAVRKFLDLKNCQYISSKNQTVRCYKCGCFQKVRTQGFDFFVYAPLNRLCFIECKTGKSRLTKPQEAAKAIAEQENIPYIVVRDTVDELVDCMNWRDDDKE